MTDRKYDLLAFLFVLALFIFAVSRARHPMRWSGLATSDAEHVTAAIHFRDEGVDFHHGLNYYHPGFLGEHTRNESVMGWEAQYPALRALILSFLLNPQTLMVSNVFFVCGKLLLLLMPCVGYFFHLSIKYDI